MPRDDWKGNPEATRNYRGRFEGDDWGMVANRRVSKGSVSMSQFFATIFSTAANKFWIATFGFILTALTSYTGIDFVLMGLTPEVIIGFIASVLVYTVPNSPNPPVV